MCNPCVPPPPLSVAHTCRRAFTLLALCVVSVCKNARRSFLHDGEPATYMTEGICFDVLHALPETLVHLKLILPFPRLPEQLTTYSHLSRIRILNLCDSSVLLELPEWLSEMKSLAILLLRRCVRLQTLPKSLPGIYSKYKDVLVDLQGCASVFRLSSQKADKCAGNCPFIDVAALGVVRNLLACAEATNMTDRLAVLCGWGRRLESSGLVLDV